MSLMAEYVVRSRPGESTVRVSRPGGVSRVRTRLSTDITLTGVTAHNDLVSRDAADAHPISSITGLEAALAASGLTAEQIMDLVAGFIAAGTGVTVTHDDFGDTLTISASVGAAALGDLTDVDTTTDPADVDDVLAWDGTNWTPATLTGVSDLDDLTDVTITAAASGDILRHNGTAWVDTPGTSHFEAAGAVSTHDASTTAHTDLRDLASGTGVRAVVNAPSTVATHAELIDPGGINLQIWPDGSACGFFTRSGTTFMVAPGGDAIAGDGVMLTEVVANDPTVNRATRKTIGSGPVGATWLGAGGGVHDTGTDLYLITHVEEIVNTYGWWYIGMSKSTDNGATWVYQYDIVLPLLDKPSLAQEAPLGNGALIEHEGYLYLFHQAILADGSTVKFAVARASVASVEADTNEWATWTGTAWVDGGVPAELLPDSVAFMQPSAFDVIEVGVDGHGLLFTDGNAGTYYLYSPDLLRWDLHQPQLVHPANNTEELYRTFWSGDPDHPKRLTDSGTLFVVSSASGFFDRWTDNKLVAYDLRRFSLVQDIDRAISDGLGADPLPQYQGTGSYVSMAVAFGGPEIPDLTGKFPGTVIAIGTHTITLPPGAEREGSEWRFIVATVGMGLELTVAVQSGENMNGVADDTVTFVEGSVATFVAGGGGWIQVDPTAAVVRANTASFAGNLSVADDTVQKALETLDAMTSGGGTVDVVSNVAQDRILGRTSSGSGDSEELTAAQARTLLGVEPQTGTPITTRNSTRFGATYITGSGFGPPLINFETSGGVATTAVAAGQLYATGFSGCSEDEITIMLIENTATSLTAGQQVHIGMFLPAADGGPGERLWTQAITIGTGVGVWTQTGLANLRRPSEGWLTFLNPSGNAGSVTMRVGVPSGSPMYFLGSSVGNRRSIIYPSIASMPTDMSAYSTFNQGSQQMIQTFPVIIGGK